MCLGKWEPIPATVIVSRGSEKVITALVRKCSHLLWFCWHCTFLKIEQSLIWEQPNLEPWSMMLFALRELEKCIFRGWDLQGKTALLLTYPWRPELLGLLITQLGPNYQHPLHQKASHGQGKVAAIHFDRWSLPHSQCLQRAWGAAGVRGLGLPGGSWRIKARKTADCSLAAPASSAQQDVPGFYWLFTQHWGWPQGIGQEGWGGCSFHWRQAEVWASWVKSPGCHNSRQNSQPPKGALRVRFLPEYNHVSNTENWHQGNVFPAAWVALNRTPWAGRSLLKDLF